MKHRNYATTLVLSFCLNLLPAPLAVAEEQPTSSVYDKLPVREVTVFKDGHAYVLHEGTMKTDAKGNVLMDCLPSPVMGTFWAYSTEPGVKLTGVVSSRDKLDVEEPSVSIEDLIKGNLGKEVIVKESPRNETYQATLVRILEQAEKPSVPDVAEVQYRSEPSLQSQNMLVLLKVAEGFKAVPINQIQNITFLDNPSDKVIRKQSKETMTLQLDWSEHENDAASQATVGMAYVQRGIRWIPSYRVEIDGQGKAVLKLQAAIINELADLNDVKTHLVIGVPNFAFKDVVDPVSFQETAARLSSHFRSDSSTAYAFSNAIMSQQRMPYVDEQRARGAQQGSQLNLGPELEGTAKAEDLFIFTLDHITLKKGQRLVLQIAEFTLSYEDVYIADISFRPPLEVQRNFNSDQQLQLAKLFSAPKAIHKIRLTNDAQYPLTTAPATILKNGQILAQGMMTYTAVGSKGDLELTTAVNIGVKNSDEQTGVTPNAINWNGSNWSKIDMLGTVELTNFSDKPVKLQVSRSVLGTVDKADPNAKIRQLSNGNDGFIFENGLPFWWNWCNWPWWWYRFNSIGQTSWTLDLKPGDTITLTYNWHYYWQ